MPVPCGGFLRDLRDFIKTNRKWWLVPITARLLIIGLLVLWSSSGVAPFIDTRLLKLTGRLWSKMGAQGLGVFER